MLHTVAVKKEGYVIYYAVAIEWWDCKCVVRFGYQRLLQISVWISDKPLKHCNRSNKFYTTVDRANSTVLQRFENEQRINQDNDDMFH